MAIHILIMKKTVIFLLVLCMILPLCACTVSSPVYASYGKYGITRNMYEYWTAYYKARFYSSFAEYGLVDGEQYDESVWDQTTGGELTLGQQILQHVDSLINELLVCAELYDQLGFNNDASLKQQLDETVEELLKKDMNAAGSRQELNAILGAYGMNTDTLRRVIEYEAKASIVSDRLFGEGGEHAVTDEEREQYYQENYHRAKHILIKTDVKYVLDDNGDPKMNIYTGKYETEELTEEEKAEKKRLAEEIFARCENGEDFEELSKEYNEDPAMYTFTDGYFISADSLFDTKYMTAVLTSQPGEIKLADTSYGLMIIKKYPLDKGLWNSETNSVFFSDMDANIIAQKKNTVFGEKYSNIVFDTEYKNSLKLSDVLLLDSRLIYSEE